MIAAYIICAIVGGGLMLLSAFFHGDHGGHEADAGTDAHFESGHADAHLWIPFLSLRFWTYFLGVFGILGLLLANFSDVPEPARAMTSVATGLGVGLLVAYLMRVAPRFEVDSSAKTEDFLGAIGRVVVAIRPGQEGKIRLNLKGDIIELLALPSNDESLEIGSDAIVVALENDRARVISRSELLEETELHA